MIIAIIQARMGSTRLPNKVLKKVENEPLLKHQIKRVKDSKFIDKTVVATSDLAKNDTIYEFCIKNKIECFRGSEEDVLSRYYECAKEYDADIIVRMTGDCPLCDPHIIDATISLFNEKQVDYAANTVPPETSKFPDGSDVEVFSMGALERAHKEVQDKHFREHVTFYFWQGDNGFSTVQLQQDEDWSDYRITVDYPEDLEVVSSIIKKLEEKKQFGYLHETIEIINNNRDIKEKNSKYFFGIGWEK